MFRCVTWVTTSLTVHPTLRQQALMHGFCDLSLQRALPSRVLLSVHVLNLCASAILAPSTRTVSVYPVRGSRDKWQSCEKSDFHLVLCLHLLAAQVFPGALSTQIVYNENMSNKNSDEFKDTAQKITTAVSEQTRDRVALSESSFQIVSKGLNRKLILRGCLLSHAAFQHFPRIRRLH